MPVFLERFVLAVCAAAIVAVMLVNPMKFDWTERISLSLSILFFAFFASHLVQRMRSPAPPAVKPPASQSAGLAAPPVVTEKPESKTEKGDIRDRSRKSATEVLQAPATGSKAEAPLPAPIREEMSAYQVPTLRELIRQMGVSQMWLSNIFQRQLDGVPLAGTVNYPAALKALAERDEVEILQTAHQSYHDFWGEVFRENIRFRVKNLAPRVQPRMRSPS